MRRFELLPIFIVSIAFSAFGQEFQKPFEGKSLVYFVRYGGALALLDFKYFDGDQYLGRISGFNYFIYECDPGEHMFWVSAENREFIKGDLKPDATYVIEVRPYARIVTAGVELIQISPSDKRILKKIRKLINYQEKAEMKGLADDQSEFIKKSMKQNNVSEYKIKELNSDWTF